MSKKKLLVVKILAGMVIVLLVCTVVSKSIYTMLLPKVEIYSPTSGQLTDSTTLTAEYGYLETQKIKANGNWNVLEVKAENDTKVKKGDVLFIIDVANEMVATSRLELAILQLNNQLNPETVKNESEKEEIAMQLDIATQELQLYNQQYPDDRQQKKAQLEQSLLDAKAQVKLSDELYDYEGLMLQLRAQQIALSDYRRANPNPDPGKMDELQLAVDNCQHQVDVYLASHYQNNALKSRLKMAEDALEAFLLTADAKYKVEQNRLELAILKINNQLNGVSTITKQQTNELKKQLVIAQQEFSIQKASYPRKGIVTASSDGTLNDFSLKAGDKLSTGIVCGNLLPVKSTSCVRWEMNCSDGIPYDVGHEVILFMMTSTSNKPKQITSTITQKKLNPQTKNWDMVATYEDTGDVVKGFPPQVKLISSSEDYEILLPLSCVVELGGGKYGMHLLETRKGLFSEETVIREIEIKVLNKNSLYAAVSNDSVSAYNLKVVQYTSKPITDGTVVSVVK